MAKIVFFIARFYFEKDKTIPPGPGYIISYLIKKKVAAEGDILVTDSVNEAITFQPDILAVSSVSHVIKEANSFAAEVKKKVNCIAVLGGYHVTSIPEKLPEKFDIGVLGEGEVTFAEIVTILNKGNLTAERMKHIKGICYRDGDTIRVNPPGELITDLDQLPIPYRKFEVPFEEIPIITSRGCPYRCIFCASHNFWKGQYRFRTAGSVVSEMCYILEKYNPKRVNIIDDLWVANKKRFRAIVDELIRLGIPEKVMFTGFLRSNVVDEETIILLKRINYRNIRFGAETGSERLLRRLKGDNISVSDHQRVIDLCDKYGLSCSASFMFGVPGETIEDIDETITFLRKNRDKIKINGFYFFNPFPGTEIWDWMIKQRMISYDFKFENLRIDFLKKNFLWKKEYYFNQDNIEFSTFRKIIKKIYKEFIYKKVPLKTKTYKYVKKLFGERISEGLKRIYYFFINTFKKPDKQDI